MRGRTKVTPIFEGFGVGGWALGPGTKVSSIFQGHTKVFGGHPGKQPGSAQSRFEEPFKAKVGETVRDTQGHVGSPQSMEPASASELTPSETNLICFCYTLSQHLC